MSLIGGRRRSRKHGRRHRRHSKRAGSALSRAAVPGLFLASLLSNGKPKHRRSTRKGQVRKTARRAYEGSRKGGTRRR